MILKTRKSTPPTQSKSSSDETHQALQGSCCYGAKAIISECQKKTEDSLERSDVVSWYLDLFSGKGSPPKLVESLGQPHWSAFPKCPSITRKKKCAGRCSHYKPWTWPPLPRIPFWDEKWEGVPMKRYCKMGIYSFSLGGIFWLGICL